MDGIESHPTRDFYQQSSEELDDAYVLLGVVAIIASDN